MRGFLWVVGTGLPVRLCPFLSIALALAPRCIVGICFMPCLLKLLWSTLFSILFFARYSLQRSEKFSLHFSTLPLSFQVVSSTFLVLGFPFLFKIFSPFSSRIYSFLLFYPHVPSSFIGLTMVII